LSGGREKNKGTWRWNSAGFCPSNERTGNKNMSIMGLRLQQKLAGIQTLDPETSKIELGQNISLSGLKSINNWSYSSRLSRIDRLITRL
jgi:hypothetical protein